MEQARNNGNLNEWKPLFKVVSTEACVILPEVSKPKYTEIVTLTCNLPMSNEKASLDWATIATSALHRGVLASGPQGPPDPFTMGGGKAEHRVQANLPVQCKEKQDWPVARQAWLPWGGTSVRQKRFLSQKAFQPQNMPINSATVRKGREERPCYTISSLSWACKFTG